MIPKAKPLGKAARERLRKLERAKHHPYVHHLHAKHHISRKTLFYMKEYGPRSHVSSVIVKESLKVLILASVISSIGGIGLQSVQERIVSVLPLLILLPALNDMVGDFGTIVSSKFTAMLYLGKVERRWWRDRDVHQLLAAVFAIGAAAAVYIAVLSFGLAALRGYAVTAAGLLSGIGVALAATLLLIGLISAVAIIGGLAIIKRNEDPNNFLIPMTTALADLGSMLLFSWLLLAAA